VVAAIVAGGCATMPDVVRRTEDWTLTLQRVSDGPNYLAPIGYTAYKPARGTRFIHTYLKIRNDAATLRGFGYDSCNLDLGEQRIVPSLVTNYYGVQDVVKGDEDYEAGESSHRMLTFSYPKGLNPTRLQCGGVTFAPLPL
jgi:hypothetical protein